MTMLAFLLISERLRGEESPWFPCKSTTAEPLCPHTLS